MNAVAPRAVPPAREHQITQGRTRYDWTRVEVGRWQNWLELGEDASDGEARRRSQNLITAARDWASRNELRVQTRRFDLGRTVDLLFTSAEADR